MSPRRMIAAVPAVCCLMALLASSGCTERSKEKAQPKTAATPPAPALASPDAGSDEDDDLDRIIMPFRLPPDLTVDTGKIDGLNRYQSAVRVYARGIGAPEAVKLCTGVVVSPRLVLTAASCVCSQQPAAQGDSGQTLLDAKVCATIGFVQTTTYIPETRDDPPGEQGRQYDAAVRVHPGFKQVLDEQGNVVSSEADLAVFVLDKATDIPPVELADSDIKAGESLVIVGHGFFTAGLDRLFSEHRVTEVLGSGGRVAFAQPPPNLYKGARGGPCLRQTRQGLRLSGILSASLGQEALFTSVYPYREWLRAEIQGAADAGNSMPQPHISP